MPPGGLRAIVTDMSNDDEFSNPLSRKTPLGGRTGVAIVSIVPILALLSS
jgi:hypothetical protein